MSFAEPYKFKSSIYNISYYSMGDDELIEILRKYFWLEMNNDLDQSKIVYRNAKGKLALEMKKYKDKNPDKYTNEVEPYLDFMTKQKAIFGSDNFYKFTFNKTTRGFQVDIKRPLGTSTRTDILSDSVEDLQTSASFYPILSITPDNYETVIEKLYDDGILHSKTKLSENIKQIIDEKGLEKGFKEAYRQIKLAYIARINEYKVHLQVKPEFQFWVLETLDALLRSEDGKFKACVEGIKMHNFYDVVNDPEKKVPSIVIYLSGNNLKQTDEEKKICAKTVINILKNIFGEYSPDIGLNKTPRYNYRIDDLIYWSNGPGDVKVKMDVDGVLATYFSETSNYSYLNPLDGHDFSIKD